MQGMRANEAKKSLKEAKRNIANKNTNFWWVGPFFVALITITPNIKATIQKHNFNAYEIGAPASGQVNACKSSSRTEAFAFWLENTVSISFNIQGSITDSQFINDDSSVKQYSMLQRGSTCYMPKTSYTGWIFVSLIIQKNTASPSNCYVSRIITTSHLEPCTGSPDSLETIVLKLKDGNYDLFGSTKLYFRPSDFHHNSMDPFKYTMNAPFGYNNLDEDFVELLILKAQSRTTYSFQNSLMISNLNTMRQAYYEKKRGKIFTAGEFVRKQIVEGLRGFHLNPDPSDHFGSFIDRREFVKALDGTVAITYQFYISKARLMTANDVYLIKIKNERIDMAHAGHTLKMFEYDIKVERDVVNNLFKLTLIRYISSVVNGQNTLSFPYTGANDDWIHFGASIGYGVLYFTSNTHGKFKRTESIHAWVSGTAHHKEMSLLEEDALTALTTNNDLGGKRDAYFIVSLQAFSASGMTTSKITNDFGLKFWELNTGRGSYWQYRITTKTTSDGRCFLQALESNVCLFYAFLTNANDANVKAQRGGDSIIAAGNDCIAYGCKYCIHAFHCAFTNPGVNEDLYKETKINSINQYQDINNYNPSKPESAQVSQFVKFSSNVGKDFFVRCPTTCGTCDQNLECVACASGLTLDALPLGYQYGQCACPIPNCDVCESSTRCRKCRSGKVAYKSAGDPNVDDCLTSSPCPDGTGYADVFQGRCVDCPYLGCKVCNLGIEDEGCTECTTTGFLAIDYSLSDFLAPGDPNYGEKKCIDSSTVVDGFYKDGSNYYRKCVKNCRTCSDGTSCSDCGTPARSSATIYSITTVTPNRCTECLVSKDEYLTDLNPKTCVVCPTGQKLMKGGTSVSSCDPCDTNNGKFVDNNQYCDDCLSDCSQCNDKTRCTRCQDATKNVQPDGTCAVGCPINHFADSDKVCQPILFTIPNCEECSSDQVCSRCLNSLYLRQDDTCSQSCPENQKGDSKKRCQPIICTIPDCLQCSANQICFVCQEPLDLISNECKTTKIVKFIEFVLIQDYPSIANFEFTFKVQIDTKGLSGPQTSFISEQILKIDPKKFKIKFFTQKEENQENLESTNANQLVLKSYNEFIYLVLSTNRQQNENQPKFKYMIFEHQKIDLGSDVIYQYTLPVASEGYEIQDYQEKEKNAGEGRLSEEYTNFAVTSDTINTNADYGTAVTAMFFSVLGIDPSGTVLEFNQFLSLIKILRLIGTWFGNKLNTFMDMLSTDSPETQTTPQTQRRALQSLIQKAKKNEKSRFFRYKLDSYSIDIEYKGILLFKIITYLVSWAVKVGANCLYRCLQGSPAESFKTWKIYLIVYSSKIHFSLMGTVAMDVIFFGARILLHRKMDNLGALMSKILAGISISLLLVDLLEVFVAASSLKMPKISGKIEQKKKGEGQKIGASVAPKSKEGGESRAQIIKKKSISRFSGQHDPLTRTEQNQENSHRRSASGFKLNNFRRIMTERRLRKHSFASTKQSSQPQILKDNQKPKKARKTKERVVDVPKTLLRKKRNEPIDLFLSYHLKKEEAIFESRICCLSNLLTLLHLGAYQLLIPTLPLLPHLTLLVLVIMEIGFLMAIVIPYFTVKHFIGWFYLVGKIIRFVFLELFLVCCLILCFESKNERKPLNSKIQELAILAIIMGLSAEYLVFFINIVIALMNGIKIL